MSLAESCWYVLTKTPYFLMQRLGDSPNINVLNHYQPSVLSPTHLKPNGFIFTGIKTYILSSYISMNIPKATMVSNLDPSSATVVFG